MFENQVPIAEKSSSGVLDTGVCACAVYNFANMAEGGLADKIFFFPRQKKDKVRSLGVFWLLHGC